MVEHRVPVPSSVLRRSADPEHSPDPRVRELVGALRDLPVSPPPRPHFRSELRAQLVAVAPRLVGEGMEGMDGLVRHTPESLATGHLQRTSVLGTMAQRLPRVRLGLSIRIATATLAVAVLLLSGAVWLSRSALPGDALYNLKRASEDVRVSLASGSGKATDLLAFARTRVHEVAELLSVPSASGAGPQADGGIGAETAERVSDTLADADEDLRQASVLLGTQAVHADSSEPLGIVLQWAPGQRDRLGRIEAHLSPGRVHDRVARSADLVDAARARAQALAADLGRGCLDRAGSDDLGPLPCAPATPGPATEPGDPGAGNPPAQPPSTSRPGPAQSPGAGPGGGAGGTGSGSENPAVLPGGNGSAGPSDGSGSATTGPPPPLQLPTLPSLPLPTLPLPSPSPSTSCEAGITLGPVRVGVGGCGIRLGI